MCGVSEVAMLRMWAFRIFWILLACLFFKYAWLTEDAFINFRVVENFLAGDGLTWNVGERVQVFTSTLWMLLLLGVSVLSGSPLFGALAISLLLMLATFWLLFKACGRSVVLFLPLAVFFVLCPSIRDYLSSGLETPLLMCAVTWFALSLTAVDGLSWRMTCFLGGVCILVRHDASLLVLPFLVQRAHDMRWWSGWRAGLHVFRDAAIGFLPLLVWTAFSVIYYGSPFPNTAGAKMVAGFDAVAQAGEYFVFMQYFDPGAYVLMALSICVLVSSRSRYATPLIFALLLFFIYLFKVGADYMAGRFFVGPLTLCVVTLAATLRDEVRSGGAFLMPSPAWGGRSEFVVLFVAIVVLGVRALVVPNDSHFRGEHPPFFHGIADERHYYYGKTDIDTLISSGVQHHVDRAKLVNAAMVAEENVFLACNIGLTGYYANRRAHIVDPLALSDRFLSGVPVRPGSVRIGHFERLVPREYVASLASGHNLFTQKILREYFDDIRLIVAGPLFSTARLAAIWRVSSGAYKDGLSRLTPKDGGGALHIAPMGESSPEVERGCLGSGGRVMVADWRGGRLELRVLR